MNVQSMQHRLAGLVDSGHELADNVGDRLASLPRPLSQLSDEKLREETGRMGAALLTGLYALKSGKTTHIGLVNRELTTFGKVLSNVGLVLVVPLVALYGHELWARNRKPAYTYPDHRLAQTADPTIEERIAAMSRENAARGKAPRERFWSMI